MLKGLAKTIRVAAGLCLAFAGAALLGAALPAAAAGRDGLIAVMFLPVGACLLWLGRRWSGRWAWGIAAVLIGYLGIATGLHGVASQGVDAGSVGHIAGWLTAAAAIPLTYLALRGLLPPRSEPPTSGASQ